MNLKFDPYQFDQIDVDGLTICVKNIPWANNFVYVNLICLAGGRHDLPGKEGTAHFFEHMPFNGCRNYPSFDAIQSADDALFLDSLNACTSMEKTEFGGKTSIDILPDAVGLLRDMAFYPLLNAADHERERKVILRELWGQFTNPKKENLKRVMNRLAYGQHTFARTRYPIGWHETVEAITVEDLRTFSNTHYHLGNIRLVLVGDVSVEQARDLAKLFADVPKGRPHIMLEQCLSWPDSPEPYTTSLGEYFGLKGDALPKESELRLVRPLPIQLREAFSIGCATLRKLLFERIRMKFGGAYTPSVGSYIYADHHFFDLQVRTAPELLADVTEVVRTALSDVAAGSNDARESFEMRKKNRLEEKRRGDYSGEAILDVFSNELAYFDRPTTLAEDIAECEGATFEEFSQIVRSELTGSKPLWLFATP